MRALRIACCHLGAATFARHWHDMNGGGPPAADAFHTPSRQVDEELKALRDEVTLLRTELGSCNPAGLGLDPPMRSTPR